MTPTQSLIYLVHSGLIGDCPGTMQLKLMEFKFVVCRKAKLDSNRHIGLNLGVTYHLGGGETTKFFFFLNNPKLSLEKNVISKGVPDPLI